MKKELTEQLYSKYPLLYTDKEASMYKSLMAFGFEVGDGWYNLIDELSSKLEPLIQKFIKENPNLSCQNCICPKKEHYAYLTKTPGKCLAIHKQAIFKQRHVNFSIRVIPKWVKNEYLQTLNWKCYLYGRKYIINPINKTFYFLQDCISYFAHTYQTCYCDKYEASYPRASQVKEKFAGLRFYMSSSTEEMQNIIQEYEAKSYRICDRCGQPGTTYRLGYWLHASCKTCLQKEFNNFEDWKKND